MEAMLELNNVTWPYSKTSSSYSDKMGRSAVEVEREREKRERDDNMLAY